MIAETEFNKHDNNNKTINLTEPPLFWPLFSETFTSTNPKITILIPISVTKVIASPKNNQLNNTENIILKIFIILYILICIFSNTFKPKNQATTIIDDFKNIIGKKL